jgi:phosphoribosylformylglycinamidine cyclo-ligase
MVALTAPDDVDRAIALLATHGVTGWVCGEIASAGASDGAPVGGSVTVRGSHPGW